MTARRDGAGTCTVVWLCYSVSMDIEQPLSAAEVTPHLVCMDAPRWWPDAALAAATRMLREAPSGMVA